MILNNFILLAAPTARSKAYIQALCHHGLYPECIILMGEETQTSHIPSCNTSHWNTIFIPNLHLSIADTCLENNIKLLTIQTNTVNSIAITSLLSSLEPKLIIYSGFSGEIVSANTLSINAPFLHLHSGELPAYRGSTTLYYALLNKEQPSVTAILLDKTIDTGPILLRKAYPRPDAAINVDQLYDSAIRADALIQVLKHYITYNTLPEVTQQATMNGQTYYVIHPVLKHIAMLSLSHKQKDEEHACARTL